MESQAFHCRRMITPNYRSLKLVQLVFALSVLLFPASLQSAPSPTPTPPGAIDEKLFSGMRWRQIGPFRGGRALAIEGVAGEPDTYYFGAVAGARPPRNGPICLQRIPKNS